MVPGRELHQNSSSAPAPLLSPPLCRSVPARLYNIYRHLHVERGWSGIGLVGMGLGSILSAGIVAIAAMDWYYAANPHLLAPRPHHE